MARSVTGDGLPKLARVIATRNGAFAVAGDTVWQQQAKGIFWFPVNNPVIVDLMLALQDGQKLEYAFHDPLVRVEKGE